MRGIKPARERLLLGSTYWQGHYASSQQYFRTMTTQHNFWWKVLISATVHPLATKYWVHSSSHGEHTLTTQRKKKQCPTKLLHPVHSPRLRGETNEQTSLSDPDVALCDLTACTNGHVTFPWTPNASNIPLQIKDRITPIETSLQKKDWWRSIATQTSEMLWSGLSTRPPFEDVLYSPFHFCVQTGQFLSYCLSACQSGEKRENSWGSHTCNSRDHKCHFTYNQKQVT